MAFKLDLRRVFAAVASLLALCACSTEEPEIAEVQARRLLIQDEEGGFSAALSVFALFNGGETADDFAMMTVTHLETGVFWEAPASAAFLFAGGDGFYWAGSSSLLPIPSIFAGEAAESAFWDASGFFPQGAYTVTADNAAESSATASFVLDAPFYFTEPPAVFWISGEGNEALWSVELSESVSLSDVSVYLFLLDEGGNPLSSIRITPECFSERRAEGRVADLAQALRSRREEVPSPAAASCYVEHAASSSAVLLSPLSLGQEVE